jgi:CBS domain-containing protein
MLVSQLMIRDVETCSPHDTLETVGRICWDHDVGVVPVVERGRVVGVITDRDVCMAAYTRGCALRDALVSSAMSSPPRACRPELGIADAMRLMSEAQVRRLVVTDAEGHLVGLLSFSDLVREAARASNARMAQDVVKSLASVCAPRSAAATAPEPVDLVASKPMMMAGRAPALARKA